MGNKTIKYFYLIAVKEFWKSIKIWRYDASELGHGA